MDRFAQARLKNMFAELLSDQSFADEVASRCVAQIHRQFHRVLGADVEVIFGYIIEFGVLFYILKKV